MTDHTEVTNDEVVVALTVTLDRSHFGGASSSLQEAIRQLRGVVRVEGIAAGAMPSALLEGEARDNERRKIGHRLRRMGNAFIYNEPVSED